MTYVSGASIEKLYGKGVADRCGFIGGAFIVVIDRSSPLDAVGDKTVIKVCHFIEVTKICIVYR